MNDDKAVLLGEGRFDILGEEAPFEKRIHEDIRELHGDYRLYAVPVALDDARSAALEALNDVIDLFMEVPE